jgi:hypothetical protein
VCFFLPSFPPHSFHRVYLVLLALFVVRLTSLVAEEMRQRDLDMLLKSEHVRGRGHEQG